MLDAHKELVPVIYGESGIKLYRYAFSANEMCIPTHWHERMELLQIIHGCLKVQLANKEIIAKAGDIVIIMPSMVHSGFAGDEGLEYHVISFDIEKFLNSTIASDKYIKPIIKRSVLFSPATNNVALSKVLDELVLLLTSEPKSNPLLTTGKIYEFIGLLYQNCMVAFSHSKEPVKNFDIVLKYINRHFTEDITSRSISQKFNYDETYFCRRFKEATGITTMKYIRILRLELAQKLLKNSNESISNISLQCGFSDTHYFANCFKNQYKLTPTAFREAHKQ